MKTAKKSPWKVLSLLSFMNCQVSAAQLGLSDRKWIQESWNWQSCEPWRRQRNFQNVSFSKTRESGVCSSYKTSSITRPEENTNLVQRSSRLNETSYRRGHEKEVESSPRVFETSAKCSLTSVTGNWQCILFLKKRKKIIESDFFSICSTDSFCFKFRQFLIFLFQIQALFMKQEEDSATPLTIEHIAIGLEAPCPKCWWIQAWLAPRRKNLCKMPGNCAVLFISTSVFWKHCLFWLMLCDWYSLC